MNEYPFTNVQCHCRVLRENGYIFKAYTSILSRVIAPALGVHDMGRSETPNAMHS